MEFRIVKTEFLRGLRLAQGIADRKSTMPMLANVLLRTQGKNQLLVAATDLNVSLTAELKSTNASDGGLTLGAKNLYELIANAPGDEITLKKADDTGPRSRAARSREAGEPRTTQTAVGARGREAGEAANRASCDRRARPRAAAPQHDALTVDARPRSTLSLRHCARRPAERDRRAAAELAMSAARRPGRHDAWGDPYDRSSSRVGLPDHCQIGP
jgi:hypothetical protein